MKIYDISVTVTPEIPTWPGDPTPQIERIASIAAGDGANVSRIDMTVHTGTHVDAPLHFVDGAGAVEAMDLDVLVGKAQVVAVPEEAPVIDAKLLASCAIDPAIPRLLFKTRNSRLWARGERDFQSDFTALDVSAAAALVERGVRLVGLDYLSVAPFAAPTPTHVTLLQAGVVLVESLDLSRVPAGVYTLVCLPVKLGGVEGAPARAILIAD